MCLNQKFRRKICVSTILGLKFSKKFLSAVVSLFSSLFCFKVKEAKQEKGKNEEKQEEQKQQKMKGRNMKKKQEQQKKETRSEGRKKQKKTFLKKGFFSHFRRFSFFLFWCLVLCVFVLVCVCDGVIWLNVCRSPLLPQSSRACTRNYCVLFGETKLGLVFVVALQKQTQNKRKQHGNAGKKRLSRKQQDRKRPCLRRFCLWGVFVCSREVAGNATKIGVSDQCQEPWKTRIFRKVNLQKFRVFLMELVGLETLQNRGLEWDLGSWLGTGGGRAKKH